MTEDTSSTNVSSNKPPEDAKVSSTKAAAAKAPTGKKLLAGVDVVYKDGKVTIFSNRVDALESAVLNGGKIAHVQFGEELTLS